MCLHLTLVLFLIFGALAGFSAWRDNRPRDSFEPSLVPWTWVMIVSALVCLLLAAHLVSLATGQTLKGRFL